jgi:hypothetical protein
MSRRAKLGRGSNRWNAVGVAVGGPTLAAVALALGANPAPAWAAPVPLPAPVATVPVVGPLVGPAPQHTATPSPGPAPAGGSVRAQAASPTLTVTPNSHLTDGQKVVVQGHGFAPGSAGGMAECNGTPNQPTQQVYGNAVPVGCTNPLNTLQATDSNGDVNAQGQQNFTIKTGTVGPPASSSTDSSGGNAQADSAKYPCPPTPDQQAQGISCNISYGDASGNQASADLHFASSGAGGGGTNGPAAAAAPTPGSSPTGGGTTAASGGSGPSGATLGSTDSAGGASTGSLPFTGFGPGLWRLTQLGALLGALGAGLVVLGRRHRRKAALRAAL